MEKCLQVFVDRTQLAVSGRVFKTARLRHEGFEFLPDPLAMIKKLRRGHPIADVFTFLDESCTRYFGPGFRREDFSVSVLMLETFEKWWKSLDYKARNKARKAAKSGVEVRITNLDDEFVRGVESIYNESPIRQGRKFLHYGKKGGQIREHLSSFPERTCFVGAYYGQELIGFMKLYQGDDILRTVHIIAKLIHRDKSVQDALIAKAVEISEERGVTRLQYGAWSRGGLGAFKTKHGFVRYDYHRYFVPLTFRGRLMLKTNLHHRLRERFPDEWTTKLIALRSGWSSLLYGETK